MVQAKGTTNEVKGDEMVEPSTNKGENPNPYAEEVEGGQGSGCRGCWEGLGKFAAPA